MCVVCTPAVGNPPKLGATTTFLEPVVPLDPNLIDQIKAVAREAGCGDGAAAELVQTLQSIAVLNPTDGNTLIGMLTARLNSATERLELVEFVQRQHTQSEHAQSVALMTFAEHTKANALLQAQMQTPMTVPPSPMSPLQQPTARTAMSAQGAGSPQIPLMPSPSQGNLFAPLSQDKLSAASANSTPLSMSAGLSPLSSMNTPAAVPTQTPRLPLLAISSSQLIVQLQQEVIAARQNDWQLNAEERRHFEQLLVDMPVLRLTAPPPTTPATPSTAAATAQPLSLAAQELASKEGSDLAKAIVLLRRLESRDHGTTAHGFDAIQQALQESFVYYLSPNRPEALTARGIQSLAKAKHPSGFATASSALTAAMEDMQHVRVMGASHDGHAAEALKSYVSALRSIQGITEIENAGATRLFNTKLNTGTPNALDPTAVGILDRAAQYIEGAILATALVLPKTLLQRLEQEKNFTVPAHLNPYGPINRAAILKNAAQQLPDRPVVPSTPGEGGEIAAALAESILQPANAFRPAGLRPQPLSMTTALSKEELADAAKEPVSPRSMESINGYRAAIDLQQTAQRVAAQRATTQPLRELRQFTVNAVTKLRSPIQGVLAQQFAQFLQQGTQMGLNRQSLIAAIVRDNDVKKTCQGHQALAIHFAVEKSLDDMLTVKRDTVELEKYIQNCIDQKWQATALGFIATNNGLNGLLQQDSKLNITGFAQPARQQQLEREVQSLVGDYSRFIQAITGKPPHDALTKYTNTPAAVIATHLNLDNNYRDMSTPENSFF